MIGWTTMAPVIKALFGALAQDTALVVEPVDGDGGTRSFEAEWKEGQRSATHDVQRLSLLLKVTTVVGLGHDETRYEYVDPLSVEPEDAAYLGLLRAVQTGQRKFTLQVQAIVPEHTDSMWAFAATERVRAGLRRGTSIAALLAVGVSLIEIKQAVKVSFKDGGRVVSAASMDVVMGAVMNLEDPSPVGWIEAVELTGHLQDVDGVELPHPPNFTDHIVPADWTPPP